MLINAVSPMLALSSKYIINSSSDIDADKVLGAANDIVSLGLKDSGYEYVNIDVRHST